MPWGFDARAHRYRDTENGQFLSRDRALELVNASLGATGNVVDSLAGLLAENMLAPEDWRLRMRAEVKGEYIRLYIMGRGGREQMTAEDWGSVGGSLSEQYRHLDRKANNFVDQVLTGDLTEGTIAARSRMYINSAREAYERGLFRRLRNSEYDEEQWVLNASVESCPDCIDNAAMGWQPIGTFPYPGGGTTRCLTNCACHKEYRISTTGDIFERFRFSVYKDAYAAA